MSQLSDELDKYMTECRVECVLTEDDYARKVGEFLKQSKFDSISTIVLEELRKGECTVSDAQAESDEEDTVCLAVSFPYRWTLSAKSF